MGYYFKKKRKKKKRKIGINGIYKFKVNCFFFYEFIKVVLNMFYYVLFFFRDILMYNLKVFKFLN